MSAFLFAAAALAALALAFVLPPLLRPASAPAATQDAAPRRAAAALIGAGLPLAAALLYAAVGTPQALLAPAAPPAAEAQGPAAIGPSQIEAMVAGLAARLARTPGDAEGWRMLARSYETLRRFDGAVDAYRHLAALEPNDAGVLTDYAVALAMTLQQNLSGEPERLIDRALAIDPNHVQALALKGSAAYERGDYAAALAPWKKLLATVPPQSDMAASIGASVAKAQALAAQR